MIISAEMNSNSEGVPPNPQRIVQPNPFLLNLPQSGGYTVTTEPDCVPLIILLALARLVMGCVAVAGLLSGTTMGGATLGLSLGLFFLSTIDFDSYASSSKKDWNKFKIVMHLALAIIGTLGLTGVISSVGMGWAILGYSFLLIPLNCCCATKK